MQHYIKGLVFLVLIAFFFSCESDEARRERLAREEQERIELVKRQKAEEAEKARKIEEERKKEAERIEKERKEKAIYEKYINNTLRTGATPYAYCYGRNRSCSGSRCSEISVRTPSTSDVLVTIKSDGEVVRHAFISKGSTYKFKLPNGIYQPFFYYGKGWNPEKVMKQSKCGTIKGGFLEREVFGKDSPQSLVNNILSYELILTQNGNFSTRPSNSSEAL